MTRKSPTTKPTTGAEQKEPVQKKPRKKKEPLPFNLDPIEKMLGLHPTHEEFEDAFKQIKKALIERILAAELSEHLGYPKGEEKPAGQVTHRNGSTPKTIKADDEEIALDIPRDRESTFEPKFVPKGLRRFKGFDDRVLGLYARGCRCGRSAAFSRIITRFRSRPT